ncbi:hypothetical protein AAFC00_000290 [Neodothiora populina]
MELSHLTNPIATPKQLQTSASQIDGVPPELEESVRYESSKLIQTAGVLLRLPQEVIAEAIIIFTRFWVGPEGGSLTQHSAMDIASATIYLVTKPSAHAVSPRQLLSVLWYLYKLPQNLSLESLSKVTLADSFLPEGTYQDALTSLVQNEAHILRVLGYQTHVALPYTLCINYLQTLEVFSAPEEGIALAKRAFAYLNIALLSPQCVYLTHQPHAIATSAIYLASKETGVKLPGDEWWEVFDVDREELGFLVVALISMTGFAEQEAQRWTGRKTPLTVEELQAEIETQRLMENGE